MHYVAEMNASHSPFVQDKRAINMGKYWHTVTLYVTTNSNIDIDFIATTAHSVTSE